MPAKLTITTITTSLGFLVVQLNVSIVDVVLPSIGTAVPRPRAGVASGVMNSVRQAGGAIGVALFGVLMSNTASGLADACVVGAHLLGLAAAACFIGPTRLAMLAGAAGECR